MTPQKGADAFPAAARDARELMMEPPRARTLMGGLVDLIGVGLSG